MPKLTSLVKPVVVAGALTLASAAGPAAAQDRPRPAVDFAAGALVFPDEEGIVAEGFAGGAARFYLLPRVAVGPEISFVQSSNHSHLIITGNVTLDLVAPVNGQPRRLTPFIVAGSGLFQSRERFPSGAFVWSEGALTAGGGVRATVTPRVALGLDARVGWEMHIRLNGFVAVSLGR